MATAIGDLVVRLFGDTTHFQRSMTRTQTMLGGTVRAVSRLARAFMPLSGTLLFAGMLRSGEDFQRKLRGSLAIMGDVSEETKAIMRRTAFDVARDTRFGAAQTAEAYYFLASAGLDAGQQIAALPAVARFAQAGNFDLARATELATDAQSAMGMRATEAQENLAQLTRVTDVLTKANTLANASSEQFSVALTTKAGAALRMVGKDIEEGVAVLAAWADQGLKAEEAGTAMNIVLRDLQTQAIKNAVAFDENRVAVFDQAGEMRGMADIVQDLEQRLDGMSDASKKATLMKLGFSDKSVIFMQTLLGTSDKIRDYENALRSAAGTTREVADKQLTPFQKGWAKLSAVFVEGGTAIMDWLGPGLGAIGDFLAKALVPVGAFFKIVGAGVRELGGLGGDVLGFLGSRDGLRSIGDMGSKALTGLTDGLRDLGAVASAAFSRFTSGLGRFGEFVDRTAGLAGRAFGAMGKNVAGTLGWVSSSLGRMGGSAIDSWRQAGGNFVSMMDVMLGSVEGWSSGVVHITMQTVYGFEALWEQSINWFRIKWESAKGWFGDTWYALGEIGVRNFQPPMAELFIWMQRKLAALHGQKWLLTPEEEAGIIASEQQAMLDKLASNRRKLEAQTNSAIEDLRQKHQDRMAAIGEKSLEELAEWEKKRGMLPKLSDRFREALNALSGVPGKQPPGTPPPGEEGLAPPERFAGAEVPRYAAHMGFNTTEAYSGILKALAPNRGDRTAEKTATNTKQTAAGIARLTDIMQQAVNRKEDRWEIA